MMRDVAWSLLHQGVGRGAVFVLFALLPGLLALDEVGRFSLLYALALLLLQPFFDTAVSTTLVQRRAAGDLGAARALLHVAARALAGTLAVGACAALIARAPVALLLAAAFALALPLQWAFALFRGRAELEVEGQAGTLAKLLLPPLALAFAACGLRDARLPALALVTSAALGWLALVILFGARWRNEARRLRGARAAQISPWPTTFDVALLAALGLVALRLDLLLLSAWAPLAEVGRYATASRWVEAAYVAPHALMLAIFPRLAAGRETRAELRRAVRAFAYAAAPVTLAAYAVVRLVVPRAYPAEGDVIAALALRLVPCIPAVFAGTLGAQALVALGHARRAAAVTAAALVVRLAVALVAIPRMGAAGAALACVAGEIGLGAASALALRRAVRRRPDVGRACGPA